MANKSILKPLRKLMHCYCKWKTVITVSNCLKQLKCQILKVYQQDHHVLENFRENQIA